MPAAVFYTIEGKLAMTRVSRNGKEFILYVHGPGWFMGIGGGGMRRVFNAQAITPASLLEVSKRDFENLVLAFPVLSLRLAVRNYLTITYLSDQYVSAFSDDAETRLKKLLARMFCEQPANLQSSSSPRAVSLDLSQEQLASAIGVSRTLLNQLLQRLQSDGLIKLTEHKISLVDINRLLSYLEIHPL